MVHESHHTYNWNVQRADRRSQHRLNSKLQVRNVQIKDLVTDLSDGVSLFSKNQENISLTRA